jgi:hypothetical protein
VAIDAKLGASFVLGLGRAELLADALIASRDVSVDLHSALVFVDCLESQIDDAIV